MNTTRQKCRVVACLKIMVRRIRRLGIDSPIVQPYGCKNVRDALAVNAESKARLAEEKEDLAREREQLDILCSKDVRQDDVRQG